MIAELGSYSLTDFLPFSPDVYLRLFARYNADVAPLQYLLLATGLALLPVLRHRHGIRIVFALLALCWLWVGWAFHWQRLATLSWVAPWFALLFATGALLLLVAITDRVGCRPWSTPRGLTGVGLYVTGVLLQPLAGLLTGRDLTSLAWFGLAPDPTVIATAGLLLMARGRRLWPVWLPVSLWLVVAALATLALSQA